MIKFTYGLEVVFVNEWGDKDTSATAKLANKLCLEYNSPRLYYDSIGVGAGIRGQFAEMSRKKEKVVSVFPWSSGDKVLKGHEFISGTPQVIKGDEGFSAPGIRNRDFFHNFKAQAWWTVGQMFYRSYQMRQGESIQGEFISISEEINESTRIKITNELSRPTYKRSESTEKVIVNKAPDNQRSPNIGDSIVIACFPSVSSPLKQSRLAV